MNKLKIAVIGGTGIIGTGSVNLLKEGHIVISIGKKRGDYLVDLSEPNEITDGLRINAVSPAFVKETMKLFGMDSSNGISSADRAKVYHHLIDSELNGIVANVPEYSDI